MILKLNTYNYFFSDSPFKYYSIEGNDNTDIEEIYYFGEKLDLTKSESYDLAIDFLKDCKAHDSEICDTYKRSTADFFLGTIFDFNLEKIQNTINEEIDKLIGSLQSKKNELDLLKGVEPTTCKEAEKTAKTTEEVSKPKTFYWAKKYIETVMDPVSELPDSDYNVILKTLTQYGEWLLKQ